MKKRIISIVFLFFINFSSLIIVLNSNIDQSNYQKTLIFIPGMDGLSPECFKNFKDSESFQNYYRPENIVSIPYYQENSNRTEFIGIHNNSSIYFITEAIKNILIQDHNLGKIHDSIDLIGFSFGGILIRTLIKFYYSDLQENGLIILNVLTLGTPNHGSWIVNLRYWNNNSNQLIDQLYSESSFMKDLNADKEAIHNISYFTYAGIRYPDYIDEALKFIVNNIQLYNFTLVNQIYQKIGLLWDGVVTTKSIALSGAINRLFLVSNHTTIAGGNSLILTNIINDLKGDYLE